MERTVALRDELRALGPLAAEGLGGAVRRIEELHWALSRRAFGGVGPVGEPVRIAHDTFAAGSYGAVRGIGGALVRLAGIAAAAATSPLRPSLASSHTGAAVLAAVNGVFGDVLEERGGELSVAMRFREYGPEPPTPKLAVFVHGLCETDASWRPSSAGSYGSRLHADHGYSPLYLRYNTGLHVSENGRRLAELLERVVREWPVEVQEIAFVGHSMGGLVARSACDQGQRAGHAWVDSVRHVFCLGSPHLGAPLEKATNVASWALQRLPETRPVATILNRRSAGIKDLRYGSLCEEDWRDRDPDELLRDHCADVPLLEHATHYFVAASRWRGPLGEAFGDLLVRYPSAAGAPRRGTRRIPFEVDNGRHLQGLNHFQLLGHPAVYELIRDWLAHPSPSR